MQMLMLMPHADAAANADADADADANADAIHTDTGSANQCHQLSFSANQCQSVCQPVPASVPISASRCVPTSRVYGSSPVSRQLSEKRVSVSTSDRLSRTGCTNAACW